MRKIRNFVIGGLQNKIFNLVLVTIILMIAAYTAVLVYQSQHLKKLVYETNDRQKTALSEIASTTMDEVINRSFTTDTQMKAYIADSLFSEVKSEVLMAEDYAVKLYEEPDAAPAAAVSPPDPAWDGTAATQLLCADGVDLNDPAIGKEIGLIGNMAPLMEAIFKNAQVSSCFIGTESGLFLITDDRAGAKFDEDGGLLAFPVTERPWYVGAKEKGGLYFSDVEYDAFTGNIGIVCAMPVYADGELAAVVGADLFLEDLETAVADSGDEKNGFTCILNQSGHIIFSPETQGIFRVRNKTEAEDLRKSGETQLADFMNDALSGFTEVREVQVGENTYYMSGAPLDTVGWAVLSVIAADSVKAPVYALQEQYTGINEEALAATRDSMAKSLRMIIILLVIVLILGTGAALGLAKRIVHPLNTITKRISSLSGNDVQFFMEDVYRTGDEIEVLAESFAELSAKTVRYVDEVRKVTAEKERIGAELGMAQAIQASQLPHLFPAFPDRHEFDVFATMTPAKEVGGDFYDFFLLDKDHIGLVMADVSGKGVPAALFMMVARILIRNSMQSGMTPGEALASVNTQLLESNEAGMFVTVWLAVLHIPTGKGIAVNAGHERPILRRAGGLYEMVVYKHSPAVAAMEGMVFREHEFELYPGDSLMVYTDGAVEATNAREELFGTERLLKALNRNPDACPEDTLPGVLAEINDFVAGAEQFDDITMMCFRYNGRSGEEKA